MKIAIAGIRGFIGSHLASRLVQDGHDPVAFERFSCAVDLRGADAFVYAGGPSQHVDALTENELGECLDAWPMLLNDCHTAKVGHVIFLSSHAVYGPSGRAHEEDEAPAPRTFYGALQAGREHIGMAFHHSKGLPFTVLRLATVYGPWMRPDALVRVFLDAALNGGEIRLEGGGAQIRPFVYIDDLAGIVAGLLPYSRTAAGEAFNIATDHASVRDLAARADDAARQLGRPGVRITLAPPRSGEQGNVTLDARKIRGFLDNWRDTPTPLERGIHATARAMMEGR